MSFSDGIVDCHVHVFDQKQPLAERRRYAPDYDALPENLLDLMDRSGVTKAVLVQPSFLGTNNTYLVDAIKNHPGRFVGVAVVDVDTHPSKLLALKNAGVKGVRLNCLGKDAPDFSCGVYADLADKVAEIGLHIEIQAEGEQWTTVAQGLSRPRCTIVVDHFGRTTAGTPGFLDLMAMAQDSDKIWFKFSAPYRFAGAAACAALIAGKIGLDRVVWGSDWPWTQSEGRHRYGETLNWLTTFVSDVKARQAILVDNASTLYSLGEQSVYHG